MNSDNPYQSPISDAEADDPVQRTNVTVICVFLGLGAGMFVGMATWIAFLLINFGDSPENWPGWACSVPAIVVAIVVIWVIALSKSRFGASPSRHFD